MSKFEDAAERISQLLPEPVLGLEDSERAAANGHWYKNLEGELRRLEGLDISDEELDRHQEFDGLADDGEQVDIDDRTRDKIQGRVFEDGLDALAFYKSYHFKDNRPFKGAWGIFLLDVGTRYVADDLQSYYPGTYSRRRAVQIARLFLHRHERFHFRVDAWAFSMEAVTRRALYEEYIQNVYAHIVPSAHCVEESLANEHAFQALKKLSIGKWMSSFMSIQPGAYANFRFKPALGKELAKAKLAHQISEGAGWKLENPEYGLFHAPFIGQGKYLSDEQNCPVFEVQVRNLAQLLTPLFCLPGRGEFRDFVVRYLHGQPHSKTDHEKFRIDNKSIVRIPNKHKGKDRVGPHELGSTLRAAGMQNKDYGEERSRTKVWTDPVPRSVVKAPL